MTDNIYNDFFLDNPGKSMDLLELNNMLKLRNINSNLIKRNWGISNQIPENLNKKCVLFLYHTDYVESVMKLKQFKESHFGGKYSVYLESIDPSIHTYQHVKRIITSYGNNFKIKYVLIIGSIEEVPTVMISLPYDWEHSTILNKNNLSAASDIYYGHFGTREMKITIGRLTSGDNRYSYYNQNPNNNLSLLEKQTNIENQVDKIIKYSTLGVREVTRNSLHDLEWVKNILGVASNDGGGNYGLDGLSDNRFMRQELEKYKNNLNCVYTELYDSYISNPSVIDSKINYDKWGNPSWYDLITCINNGTSLLLYVGHANETQLSTTGFTVSDSDYLSNTNKLFLGCAVGCSLGSHDEHFMSLAEQFQTLKDKGSIAMFASSILQSWTAPMIMQRQLNNIIINATQTMTIGEIFEETIKNEDFNNNIDYFYYQLLGDPTTPFILTDPQIRSQF